MISFDLYSQERYLSSINDNQLSDKGSFGLFSSRDKNINNIFSTSIIKNQSNSILNNSNGNINNKFQNSYIYQNSPTSPREYSTISTTKKSLEYDIKIAELKEKLKILKEENKNNENNINLSKLRINKLQNEEKASLRELENTQKRILKIKNNRKNANNQKYSSKKRINLNLSSIKNTNSNNYNYTNKKINYTTKNNKSIIDTECSSGNKSQILLKIKNNLNNLEKHNSYRVNLKNRKNTFNILSPKLKYFITKNGINNSYDMIQTDNANYMNNGHEQIKSSIFKKKINKNKSDLRAEMKNNLIKKLKEDELNKKKIEEEIKQIEKEQYDLCINFSLNLYSGNTESNSQNTNDKRMKMYEEYENDDNIVNYNYT